MILLTFFLITPSTTSGQNEVRTKLEESRLATEATQERIVAETPHRLWVAHRKAGIVEYDLASFAAIDTVRARDEILWRPDRLSINSRGQMLYQDGASVWLWYGDAATEWSFGSFEAEGDSSGVPTRIQSTHGLALSDDGNRLYWFEQQFERTFNAYGNERAQRVDYRVWSTDLAGGSVDSVLSILQEEWCTCPTGACCDSCMEWLRWVRGGTLGRLLLLIEYREGTFGPVSGRVHVYRESSDSWQHETMREIPVLLDMTEDASIAIGADYDVGCCGWANESNDQMFLVQDGVLFGLYDEWTRFRNQRYDTSIYVGNARLSPDRSAVAYTLESSGGPDRLSWGATSDAADSLRIDGICATLPSVEMQHLEDETRSPILVSRGELIGWVSETEVLILKDGRLAVFDTTGQLRRDSQIAASDRNAVFLR